jgi:hypothetical protein
VELKSARDDQLGAGSSIDGSFPERDRGASLRPWGFPVVAVLTLVLAIPLHLDASWPVVAFAIVGAGTAAIVSRLSILKVIVVVLLLAIVGAAVMELDSVVQYSTWRAWSTPPAIHTCGVTLYQRGADGSLAHGDAPPLAHLWTTPAGAYVYGYGGCPSALNGLIIVWNGRFLSYTQ